MTTHSVGAILSINDPSVFYEIKSFFESTSGIKVIYITLTKDNRLYIIDETRLKQNYHKKNGWGAQSD